MAEPQWKVGDVVQLKSGGPKMTIINVTSLLDSVGIECAWFDDNKPASHIFPPAALSADLPKVLSKKGSRDR